MRGWEGQYKLKILRLQKELERERKKNLEMTQVLLDRLINLQKGYDSTLTIPDDTNIDDINTHIPLSIFRNRRNLGPLQTIVSYLRDEHRLTFTKIGKLLGRDYRTISTTYANVKRKEEFK